MAFLRILIRSSVRPEADNKPRLFEVAFFFSFYGFSIFFAGGWLLFDALDLSANWPRWLRLSCVSAFACVGAYVIGRLFRSLFHLLAVGLVLGVAAAIGLLW